MRLMKKIKEETNREDACTQKNGHLEALFHVFGSLLSRKRESVFLLATKERTGEEQIQQQKERRLSGKSCKEL